MKIVAMILLFSWALNLYGQKTTVNFVQMQCDNHQLDFDYRNIVITKNDKLISINPLAHRGRFELEGLDHGTYYLSYLNIYGQWTELKIKVDAETHEVVICTDHFAETKGISLFSELGKKDTLVMHYHSLGCWHEDIEKYVFYFEANRLHMDYYKGGNQVISKMLMKEDLKKLESFEKKLRHLEIARRGCDTYDDYIFELNDISYSITDASCYWQGYRALKSSVLGIVE